jgi:hypothetical protein
MRERAVILIAVFAVLLVLICVGASMVPTVEESYEKPDLARMRAHRMSLLTDAQVLELHASAINESAN